jgi:hypothetical protein
MADQMIDDWPDPAGLGPDVNGASSTWQRTQQQTKVRGWLAAAEEAILLEADRKERAAVDKWRELFGTGCLTPDRLRSGSAKTRDGSSP